VELVGRWWNSHWGRLARRDIWLTFDGNYWYVRARQGGDDGREVTYHYDREDQAQVMVDRLIATSPPAKWKNVIKLYRPEDRQTGPG
jgi:hypothetical protein